MLWAHQPKVLGLIKGLGFNVYGTKGLGKNLLH